MPRVVSAQEALGRGMTPDALRHAVRTGRWQRLARGVYLTVPGPRGRGDWIRAALQSAGPCSAVSGWDALQAYGVGPSGPPAGHALVLDRTGAPRLIGPVRVRPTTRAYGRQHVACRNEPPLPVAAPARAVADAALTCRALAPARALVASAVQRQLCRPDELLEELRHGPRRGSALLRQALEEVAAGARSVAEAEAAAALRAAGLSAFELNVPIRDGAGRLVAVADVLWRSLRAILEVDSREFHYTEADWKSTMARHNALTRLSFAVAHYPPSRIRADGVGWAREVELWLRRRADELAVTWPGC